MKSVCLLIAVCTISVNILHGEGSSILLPGFMDQTQLEKWKSNSQSSPALVSSSFFTGKPYSAHAGGYIFKFRTFDPDLGRWTVSDPTGFPDGSNNHIFSGSPVSGLDADGASYQLISSATDKMMTTPGSTVKVNGDPYTVEAYDELVTDISSSPVANGKTTGTVTAYGAVYLQGQNGVAVDKAMLSPSYTWTVSVNQSGSITITPVGGQLSTNTSGLIVSATPAISGNTVTWTIAASGAVANQTGTVTDSVQLSLSFMAME